MFTSIPRSISIPTAETYDVRTVMLHEFGHFLDLDDIPWYEFWNRGAIMWYAYKGVQHTLAQDDINGARAIYGP